MQNVWKVGSNWGDGGLSILDLFLDYECVFFGSKHDSGIGDYGNVRNGDLLIVADGSVPVAIGVATGTFKSYAECGIRFRRKDADDFIDDDVAICPAHLVLLSEEERGMYWGMETRRLLPRRRSSGKGSFVVGQARGDRGAESICHLHSGGIITCQGRKRQRYTDSGQQQVPCADLSASIFVG